MTAPDVYESLLPDAEAGAGAARRSSIRKAVTIDRPRDEVENAWAAAAELRGKVVDAGGSVQRSRTRPAIAAPS